MRNKLKFNRIRLQETADLEKTRDNNTQSLRKQFSKTSNLGGTDESQMAYGYEDEKTFAESEQKVVLEKICRYDESELN